MRSRSPSTASISATPKRSPRTTSETYLSLGERTFVIYDHTLGFAFLCAPRSLFGSIRRSPGIGRVSRFDSGD